MLKSCIDFQYLIITSHIMSSYQETYTVICFRMCITPHFCWHSEANATSWLISSVKTLLSTKCPVKSIKQQKISLSYCKWIVDWYTNHDSNEKESINYKLLFLFHPLIRFTEANLMNTKTRWNWKSVAGNRNI